MVSNSGASSRASKLRPLNTPRPVRTFGQRPDGAPRAVTIRGTQQRVAEVRDTWLIEDEWWRKPIRRQYFQLLLADGVICTLYHDLVEDRWYAQSY